ncbi:glycosyltransferase [Brevibacterium sp. UCMA 11752]|uniref:glycosyltransferase n=1 Tax=Brevibacterium sp. UCMA 11752 TaxID=2745946 RepID=UPI003FA46500
MRVAHHCRVLPPQHEWGHPLTPPRPRPSGRPRRRSPHHRTGHTRDGPKEVAGARIIRVPSIALPKYRRVRVAPGGVSRIKRLLENFNPDVVHLASPFCSAGVVFLAAQSLDLPTVAIYQTEVPPMPRGTACTVSRPCCGRMCATSISTPP